MSTSTVLHCLVLGIVLLNYVTQPVDTSEVKINKRTKRAFWMTHNRKLVLPRGTVLDLAPRIQIPFIRQAPEGINSDIQVTWHFYMYFDKLGMTSDEHWWPFFNMRNQTRFPLFPFSGFYPYSIRAPAHDSGAAMNPHFARRGDKFNSTKEDFKEDFKEDKNRIIIKKSQRVPRSVLSLPPPEKLPGGERAILIPQLEKMIASMGYDGRNCLFRAVCEVHEYPLHKTGFGLLGEIMTLVFSVSQSTYAESHLPEYLKAEKAGREGECSSYFKDCSKSMFTWEEKNKYSEEMQNVVHDHQKTKF